MPRSSIDILDLDSMLRPRAKVEVLVETTKFKSSKEACSVQLILINLAKYPREVSGDGIAIED